MSTHTPNRVQAGVRQGGQFTTGARTEADVSLSAANRFASDARGRVSMKADALVENPHRYLVNPFDGSRLEIVDQVRHSSAMPGHISVPVDVGTLFIDADADIEVSNDSEDRGAKDPQRQALTMQLALVQADTSRPDYPDAEHKALSQALNAYEQAAQGKPENRYTRSVPIFAEVELWKEPGQLPQWPASLPKPRVSFEMTNDRVYTSVSFDGRFIEAWTIDDDVFTNLEDKDRDHRLHPLAGLSEEDADQVSDWVQTVHEHIDTAAYSAQTAGVNHPSFQDAVLDTVVGDARQRAGE